MDSAALNERLSRISTQWTLLFRAHAGEADAAASAQREWLQRYSGAVYRYLLGAVRDPDVASELAQEFALRVVRGDFRRADPGRGRFRDYLKTALIHLVTDHHRARQAWPRALAPDGPEPAAPPAEDTNSEQDFLASWREELLARTWTALAEANTAYHTALLFRVENPEASSAEAAEQLSGRLGKPVTAAWVRKTVQRAQEKFAALLLEEVVGSLETSDPTALAEELRALDLLRYCRSALECRRKDAS
jgi:DNA-directed RNA polymerase specialized sigma24 family protein